MSEHELQIVQDNIVEFRPANHQDEIRKLQVKAAVNKSEKERFELLASRMGTKLSILIREQLDLLARAAGI